jgi:hypothetical protein
MDVDDPTTEPDTHWSQVAQRHYEQGVRGTHDGDRVRSRGRDGRLSGRDEVPPLYDVVDAAALENTFFGSDVAGESRQGTGTVEFR